MLSMKLFVDDERDPPNDNEPWFIVRNYTAFYNFLRDFGCPDFISFDHDLGENTPTGFDIAKLLVDYDMDYDIINQDFKFYVHSQNPVGKVNIERYLSQYLEMKFNEVAFKEWR